MSDARDTERPTPNRISTNELTPLEVALARDHQVLEVEPSGLGWVPAAWFYGLRDLRHPLPGELPVTLASLVSRIDGLAAIYQAGYERLAVVVQDLAAETSKLVASTEIAVEYGKAANERLGVVEGEVEEAKGRLTKIESWKPPCLASNGDGEKCIAEGQ